MDRLRLHSAALASKHRPLKHRPTATLATCLPIRSPDSLSKRRTTTAHHSAPLAHKARQAVLHPQIHSPASTHNLNNLNKTAPRRRPRSPLARSRQTVLPRPLSVGLAPPSPHRSQPNSSRLSNSQLNSKQTVSSLRSQAPNKRARPLSRAQCLCSASRQILPRQTGGLPSQARRLLQVLEVNRLQAPACSVVGKRSKLRNRALRSRSHRCPLAKRTKTIRWSVRKSKSLPSLHSLASVVRPACSALHNLLHRRQAGICLAAFRDRIAQKTPKRLRLPTLWQHPRRPLPPAATCLAASPILTRPNNSLL